MQRPNSVLLPFIFLFLLANLLLPNLISFPAAAQNRPDAPPPEFSIKEHYTKYEYRIPMRDGVHLFTSIYVPKDSSKTFPFLIDRTPYSVGPYGVDQYRRTLGPAPDFDKAGYIFVFRDASAPRQQEIQAGRGRRQRSLRHHRLAAEERSQQQWERRNLGHFLSRLLYFGKHHRLASRAESGFSAGSHDRPLHGRRRLPRRRIHVERELRFL